MSYVAKTNWLLDDLVLPADMNRIEQGISDADVAVSEHLLNLLNPHGTTKAQVGLSEVANYGVASQAQAEAGTVTDKYMTPERTKQAISTLQAVKSVAGKTGDVVLSKADVGLGNVDNVQQIPLSQKGVADGIATLDATGNVPVGQLGNVPPVEIPFDFDNFYGRQGHTYKTEKDVPTIGNIKTSIINTSTEAVVATMTTEKDIPTVGQIRTTLYVTEDNITITKTLSIDGSGNIMEVIS